MPQRQRTEFPSLKVVRPKRMYEQIAEQIEALIRNGDFAPGAVCCDLSVPASLPPAISFEDVRFGYDADHPVLNGLSHSPPQRAR